ncbi:hypothetical protein HG535_0A02930 [Zygotorulaspora mrakii]|uniref:Amino acid transporter transmembrane domain-containing protein n=1 Tax=Zygotorulaspora mrakii TaxID=42260 RepID=A0A7H9AW87_ZYGMR|nr:uncharacterized protein HG535_0A02930 [Zygotorulaspora mrakii]QLG70354.1 hypothetical protein HG535_0A02930 [Zygotorulaspora mrakii]
MFVPNSHASGDQQPLVPKAAITIPRNRSRKPSALMAASFTTSGKESFSRSLHMTAARASKSFDSHVLVDVESPNFKTQLPEEQDEILNSLRKNYLVDHYKRDSRSLGESHDMTNTDSLDVDKGTSVTSDISDHTLTPNLSRAGGDITRDIYKYATNENNPRISRSLEDIALADENRRRRSTASGLNVPGGFRREFIVKKVRKQQNQQKSNSNDYASSAPSSSFSSVSKSPSPINPSDIEQVPFLTRNFMEFLYIYGHFAGESFEDDFLSDESDLERNAAEGSLLIPDEGRAMNAVDSVKGTTPTSKAFLLLLKSFIGTGVLFLPHAFSNGGLLFSIAMLAFFGLYSYWCYYILIVSKNLTGVSSFGDIGYKLYGSWMKFIILLSLVLTQFGFSGAYVIFTAENLKAFTKNIFLIPDISIVYFIILQLIIFIPLSFIRNVSKLSLPCLFANFFIMAGLVIVFVFSFAHLSDLDLRPAEGTIIGFNSNHWTVFIGTAIFAFEGIGLIIPVQDSMRNPEKFPLVLGLVIMTATVLFILIGTIGYMAYGSTIETVILLNLPQKNIFVNLIQFFYSLAIMLSTPLQLFPAIKIVENKVFPKFTKIYVKRPDNTTNVEVRLNSGKLSWKLKWLKNFVRAIMVSLVCSVAYFGADHLDKFVSIIGSFACIPLVYMYPPMLHLQSCSRPNAKGKRIPWASLLDYGLIVFGGVAMLYTSYQSIFSG